MGHLREIQSSWYVCSFGSINMEKKLVKKTIQSNPSKKRKKQNTIGPSAMIQPL